jgi:hypothetical protein
MAAAPEVPADTGAVKLSPHCKQAPEAMGGCHCVQAVAAAATPLFHLHIAMVSSSLGQIVAPLPPSLMTARFRPPILSLYG